MELFAQIIVNQVEEGLDKKNNRKSSLKDAKTWEKKEKWNQQQSHFCSLNELFAKSNNTYTPFKVEVMMGI